MFLLGAAAATPFPLLPPNPAPAPNRCGIPPLSRGPAFRLHGAAPVCCRHIGTAEGDASPAWSRSRTTPHKPKRKRASFVWRRKLMLRVDRRASHGREPGCETGMRNREAKQGGKPDGEIAACPAGRRGRGALQEPPRPGAGTGAEPGQNRGRTWAGRAEQAKACSALC